MLETSPAADSACSRCSAAVPATAETCPGCGVTALVAALPRFSGSFLASYEILELLGKGGMGTVLKARHRRLDRIITIKLVNLVDPEAQERFLQEGRLLAKLDHERIISAFDSGKDENVPYLVCEYVEGRSLRDVLDAESPLPIDRALDIGIQLLEGLGAAHEHHVIHRDIKPDNILITPAWKVKIADFGLARSTRADIRRTSSGVMIGTPSYMSPEQITGDEISPATDLYAAGIVLFELLTGRAPYEGRVALEVLNQHVAGAIPKVSTIKPDLNVPRALDTVLEMALAKSPAHRFATAEAFRGELKRIREALANQASTQPAHPVVLLPADGALTRQGTLAIPRAGAQGTARIPQDRPDPPAANAGHPALSGHAGHAPHETRSQQDRRDPFDRRRLDAGARLRAALGLLAVVCLMVAAFLRPGQALSRAEAAGRRYVDRALTLLREGRPRDVEGRTVTELVDAARKRHTSVDISPVIDESMRLVEELRASGRILAAGTCLDRVLEWRPAYPPAVAERRAIEQEIQQRRDQLVVSVQGPAMRFVDDFVKVLAYTGRPGHLLLWMIEPSGRRTLLFPREKEKSNVDGPSEIYWTGPDQLVTARFEEAGEHVLYGVLIAADQVAEPPDPGPREGKAKDMAAARKKLESWITAAGPAVLAWKALPFVVWPREARTTARPSPAVN